MKVLMIAPQPFFEPRGTPISVYQRLLGLSQLGYQVDLLTYPIGNDLVIPGVTIYRTLPLPFIKTVKVGPSFAKLLFDIVLIFHTVWMLLRRRYDAVHSHEESAFFVALLAPLFGTPHVYDMHSSLPNQLVNFNYGHWRLLVKLFEWLEYMVVKTADVVLTIGHDLEEQVFAINPQANHIRIENIITHSDPDNGWSATDLRDELGLTNELCLVYTGTFERYQGLDLLLHSVQQVIVQYPDVRLIMVGGKPEQVEELRAKAAKMGLSEQVRFTGIVPLAESLRFLEMADILVSPRTNGPSVPLKIYTYLHAGRPILATNIPAHVQILNEETAVLTNPTANEYAAGLRQLIGDPALRAQFAQAAKAYAEAEFSFEHYVHRLEKAYLSIKLATRIADLPKQENFHLQSVES